MPKTLGFPLAEIRTLALALGSGLLRMTAAALAAQDEEPHGLARSVPACLGSVLADTPFRHGRRKIYYTLRSRSRELGSTNKQTSDNDSTLKIECTP